MARGQEVYQLTFTRDMGTRPILQDLGKKFRLVVTLKRAILNEEGGFAEVMLDGAEEEIGRAVADLQTIGVNTVGPMADSDGTDTDEPVNSAVRRGTYIGRGT